MKRALLVAVASLLVGALLGGSAFVVTVVRDRARRDRFRAAFAATGAQLVALDPVSAGSSLSPVQLAQRSVPVALLPSDGTSPERAAELLGARLILPVASGDPIRRRDLAREWTEADLERACEALGGGR